MSYKSVILTYSVAQNDIKTVETTPDGIRSKYGVTVHDTMSNGTKEIPPGVVRIYLCGVTVYDDTHIGHARTIIHFDVFRRHLESTGYDVTLIQNFTDIDDKILQRATKEDIPYTTLTDRYIERYHEDFDRLHVRHADAYPRATSHIDDIQSMISGLLDTGHAYRTESGVYYKIRSFPEYGKLSGKDTEGLLSGARIEPRGDKDDPMDFALWKRADAKPYWNSPWGIGRPGWHIECSAMSLRYLGEEFEIHGGGRDLIFPHHENEIAQSEGYTCKRQAKIWMHTGMVTIAGQKMSKSLGNIKSTRSLLKMWGPNVIRLFCMSGHYRKPLDYSDHLLHESLMLWRRLEIAHHTLEQSANDNTVWNTGTQRDEFDASLAADMNTHQAIKCMMDLAREAGTAIASGNIKSDDATLMYADLRHMTDVLGLRIERPNDTIIQDITESIGQRQKMRQKGSYREADAIRDSLGSKGVELLDYPKKTFWVYHEFIPGDMASGTRDSAKKC